VIAVYAPGSVSAGAAGFARGVVAQGAPATPARGKAWLFAAAKLACFAESVGLELSSDVVLCEAVIERFVLVGCPAVSPATRRTLRTNLRALARALERYPQPLAVPLVRERASQPYSLTEIDGFLGLADAQSTRARGLRASALVCLGAGAGVIAGELRHVRGRDIVKRSGGVLVKVAGTRRRAVPVLERYQQRLLQSAAFAGERYVIGGRNPDRRNVTDTLSAALSTDSSLPRLQAGSCARRGLLSEPGGSGFTRLCRRPGSPVRSGSVTSPPVCPPSQTPSWSSCSAAADERHRRRAQAA
jgi:hypothetical protein